MHLQPLRFDNHANVVASVKRLQRYGLVRIGKASDHYFVKATDQLADSLLVSENGETYLINDVLALGGLGAIQENVRFANKQGHFISVATMRKQPDQIDVLHNRPLAMLLGTLRLKKSQYRVSIPNRTGLFSPFPPMFPVITQAEETQEELDAANYNRFARDKGFPILFTSMLPNKALAQLIIGSIKTNEELIAYQDKASTLSHNNSDVKIDDLMKSVAQSEQELMDNANRIEDASLKHRQFSLKKSAHTLIRYLPILALIVCLTGLYSALLSPLGMLGFVIGVGGMMLVGVSLILRIARDSCGCMPDNHDPGLALPALRRERRDLLRQVESNHNLIRCAIANDNSAHVARRLTQLQTCNVSLSPASDDSSKKGKVVGRWFRQFFRHIQPEHAKVNCKLSHRATNRV